MSGLEVIGAVAAVVSAFHDGAELVAHLKKKHRRRSSKGQTQQEFEEKQLQESLEAGESQIIQRFAADVQELGETVRVGDAIARNRLLHIAAVMQAEIIKSLQLAVKYDNAILNLTILHEASIMNRKDSIVTLDELKQRILTTRPVPRTLTGLPEEHRFSVDPVHTFQPAYLAPVPDNYIPSAVTISSPGESKDSKTGLAKYFSMKRSSSQSSTSSPPRPVSSTGSITFSPALNHFLQGGTNRATIMTDIDDIISSYQGLHTDENRRDTWSILNDDGNGGGPKRDTLTILNGGEQYKRDTIGMDRDAVQMLRNLPPTPEEVHEISTSDYPAFNRNFFEQQSPSKHLVAPKPLSQRPALNDPRWSATSSVYSDVYSHDSRSSNESPIPQDYSHHTSPVSQYPPFNALHRNQNAAAQYTTSQFPQSPARAPSTAPQGTLTPPMAPFVTSYRPETPPKDHNHAPKAGHRRIHLVPDHNPLTSSLATAPRPDRVPHLTTPTSSPSLPPAPPPKGPNTAPLTQTSSATSSSSPPSIRTATILGPKPSTSETMMSGRPCKANNYWGFCKGAWATREDVKRGLGLQTRPDGLYNTHQVFQCQHCRFQGEVFSAPHAAKKGKRELIVDPSVYMSAVGIRYKWVFLAKSHVRRKTMDSLGSGRSSVGGAGAVAQTLKYKGEDREDCNYGCLLCSVEGNVTGIYGNTETLMNHIFLEHRSGLSETAAKARCVVGRTAGVDEEWDLNITGEVLGV